MYSCDGLNRQIFLPKYMCALACVQRVPAAIVLLAPFMNRRIVIMKMATHKWHRYLFLLPALILIINALFFKFATEEINGTLLREKYVEIVNAVDMLGAAVEADPDRSWIDHVDSIRCSVEFLDSLHQVYAALYMRADDRIALLSAREYETSPLDPMEYVSFREAVLSCDSGSVVIGYAPESQTYRNMHIYFKWMPSYSSGDERFLVVAGVSSYSVSTSIALWVSAGQWASMGITFALNLWLVFMLLRIDGETKQKSRLEAPEDGS